MAAAGRVDVDELALLTQHRRLGSGAFPIELVRSDGGPAWPALQAALDPAAVAAYEQVALTPRGAAVITHGGATKLVSRATALATALAAAGVTGTLRPYWQRHPAFDTPLPDVPRTLLGAGWVVERRHLTGAR